MIAFIDTNIILECKDLKDLPWSEVTSDDHIRVLLVPTVLKQVDERKRDGRLGKKARSFNRLIAPAATSGLIVTVRDSDPLVTLEIAKIGRVDWEKHQGLDPDDSDACIVAEVLAELSIPDEDKALISQDIHPLSMAFQGGLKTHHVSGDWLPPKEPSPSEKEMMRLKQKVRDYQRTEPELKVEISAPIGPLRARNFQPLTEAEKYDLQRRILSEAPIETRHSIYDPMSYDYGYNSRLERYRTKTVPAFVEEFSKNLSHVFSQFPFSVTVENSDNVRADRMIVAISCERAWMHNKYVVIFPSGPPVPQERNGMSSLTSSISVPTLAGRHDMHFDVEPERYGQKIEAHCLDFPQGREWIFSGVLTLDPNDADPAVLRVAVSAANLHGIVSETVQIEKEIAHSKVHEFVDFEKRDYTQQFPMQKILEEAYEHGNFNLFELAYWEPD